MGKDNGLTLKKILDAKAIMDEHEVLYCEKCRERLVGDYLFLVNGVVVRLCSECSCFYGEADDGGS